MVLYKLEQSEDESRRKANRVLRGRKCESELRMPVPMIAPPIDCSLPSLRLQLAKA